MRRPAERKNRTVAVIFNKTLIVVESNKRQSEFSHEATKSTKKKFLKF